VDLGWLDSVRTEPTGADCSRVARRTQPLAAVEQRGCASFWLTDDTSFGPRPTTISNSCCEMLLTRSKFLQTTSILGEQLTNSADRESRYEASVKEATERIARPTFYTTPKPMLGPAIISEIVDITTSLDRLLTVLTSDVNTDRRECDAMEGYASSFVEVFNKAGSLPLIRPWIFVVRRVRHIVALTQDAIGNLLRTQLEGNRSVRDRFLNAAEAGIAELNAEAEVLATSLIPWHQLISATHPDEIVGRFSALVTTFSGVSASQMQSNMERFELIGNEYCTRLTGRSVEYPLELKTYMMMAETSIGIIGDIDAFRRIAAETYRYMMGRPERAASIARSDGWLRELSTALAISYFDGDTVSAVIAGARTEPGLLGGLLNLGKDLVEAWSRVPVATLLAVRAKDLDHWLRRDAGAVLQSASQGDTGSFVMGIPVAVRNAAAHHTWRLEGQVVEFRDNTGIVRTRMHWSELTDSLLGGVENYLALVGGLCLAAADFGVSMEPFSAAATEHLPYQFLVRGLAGLAGYSEVEFEDGDSRLSLTISGFPIDIRATAIAGGFAVYAPETFTKLVVKTTDGQSYESDAVLLRKWMKETRQPHRHILLFALLGSELFNGKHLLSQADYEVVVARGLINALESASGAELEPLAEVLFPVLKSRSMKLFRAVKVLFSEENVESRLSGRKIASESLLAWLHRRAALPMPTIPGWQ
jgi:hypothetical protein